MRFDYSTDTKISESKKVKVKIMGDIVEVVSVLNEHNGFQNIKKLDKAHYVDMDTGEILAYRLNDNRGQNKGGLKDTFKKIRDLINNNFRGAGNELFATLTYKDNMTDTKKLYDDFHKFMKRFRYKYGDDIDYISIVEPQARGAWHCHVLIRFNDKNKIYISSHVMADLWGHGFVKISSLKNVDNIGAYITAYLTDVEVNDNSKESEEIINYILQNGNKGLKCKEVEANGVKKQFIKGGRLHMYPPGMNLYRHSKGIVFPEVQEMEYAAIKKIVGTTIPNYSKVVTIFDDAHDNKFLNQVIYENYNLKRK